MTTKIMNKRLLIALMPLVLAIILIGIFMALRWPFWEQSLMSDQSPAAWLSSAQLLALAFLACRLGLDHTLEPGLSMWLTLAMAMLAFDEQFMLHEYWKYGCPNWIAACNHSWVRELPMMCVALFGAITLTYLAWSVHDRLFRRILYASLGVGLLALFIDLFSVPVFLTPFEEALEVFSEALFIGALLIAVPKQNAEHLTH